MACSYNNCIAQGNLSGSGLVINSAAWEAEFDVHPFTSCSLYNCAQSSVSGAAGSRGTSLVSTCLAVDQIQDRNINGLRTGTIRLSQVDTIASQQRQYAYHQVDVVST